MTLSAGDLLAGAKLNKVVLNAACLYQYVKYPDILLKALSEANVSTRNKVTVEWPEFRIPQLTSRKSRFLYLPYHNLVPVDFKSSSSRASPHMIV